MGVEADALDGEDEGAYVDEIGPEVVVVDEVEEEVDDGDGVPFLPVLEPPQPNLAAVLNQNTIHGTPNPNTEQHPHTLLPSRIYHPLMSVQSVHLPRHPICSMSL